VPLGTDGQGDLVTVNILADTETTYGLRAGSLNASTFWAIYILHELGHIENGFGDDTGNSDASKQNTQTVVDNCFGSLKK